MGLCRGVVACACSLCRMQVLPKETGISSQVYVHGQIAFGNKDFISLAVNQICVTWVFLSSVLSRLLDLPLFHTYESWSLTSNLVWKSFEKGITKHIKQPPSPLTFMCSVCKLMQNTKHTFPFSWFPSLEFHTEMPFINFLSPPFLSQSALESSVFFS